MIDVGRARDGEVQSMDGSLRIRVLGELDIRHEGVEIGPVASAKGRSLLAYLVCHPDEWHSRQRLAFIFWPESNESQARTNLRNLIHVIRRAAPATERFIETSAGSMRWRSDPSNWVDLAAFVEAAERAERADPGSDGELAALREATDLYRGDLLEECYDDWAVTERERLRDRMVSVLRRLAEALSDGGAHADAIVAGREVTRRAPLDEDGYRLRMRLHAAAGDTTGAMRVYHECAAILRQELGVEPSAATTEAYAGLTRTSEIVPDQRAASLGSPFVGRARELDRLEMLWAEAEHGRSRLVLLTGEAGIGKTRLADEIAGWVAHRGGTVCHARAYAAEGDLGFGVVASWLRNADVMAQFRRLARSSLAELSRILPELDEPRHPTPASSADDGDRLRLFEACMTALASAGKRLLLVVDDAQWGDPPSLQFVHYLLRNSPRCPLLVLATVRRDDLERDHPLQSIAKSLAIADKACEIELEPLDRAQSIALATSVAGMPLDDSSGNALYEETEGNPLFIVETLRVRADASAGAAMTSKLRAVIAARLERLGDEARSVLDLAATVGRSFTPALVGRAGGFDEQTLVRALDELWRRGLIREHDLDGYDFSHGKIREAAYDALSPVTRRRNHLAIGTALVELDPDAVTATSGQIAVNFDRAGELRDAVAWYGRAARDAMLRSAYSEAVRFLERARELASALPGEAGTSKELEVLAMLSPAIAAADSYASARHDDVLRRATELSAILHIELDPSLLRSRVMRHLCRNEFEQARTAAAQLAESASRSGDAGLAIESQYLLGISAFWACDLLRARDHFLVVIDRFHSVDRDEHALRFGHDPNIVCTSRLANTMWFLGHADEALAARDRAMQLSADTPHPFSANVAKVFAAVLALDTGDPDDIRRWAAELDRGGDRSWVFALNASVFNGYVDALAGRSAGVQRMRAAIDDLRGAAPAPGAISTLTRVLVGAHEFGADPAAGLDAADGALELEGTRLWEAELRRLRGVFLARSGAAAPEVRSELDRATEVAEARIQRGPAERIAMTRSALADLPGH
jgi:DNA-binding SARP family transcriptional activator